MAFIDDGSKISLIEESVVKAVGLKGPQDLLSLRWIGGKTTSELSQHIDLEVTGVGENIPYYQIRNVRTTKKLELPAQTLNFESFKLKYKISNDISVDDYENAIPRMLIGMPHINLVRPLEVINLDECFSIHRSNLGCILFGSNEESADGVVCRIDCDVSTMRDIQKQMAEYFSIDNFGVKPLQPVISEADKRAQTILFETTKQITTQYETGLLWAYDEIEFVESYNMALRRLEIIESKMSKDKTFFEWYNNKIAEYLNKSYARKLSHSEALKICPQTWYLPHFAVCNINKENKRRLVFDAAASINGVSFNSRLMKGPEAYQPKPLLSILFKFRQGQIGVCADIREMFHRVKIREADQEAQRFLWRNGDSTKEPEVYVMTAMIFGSVCSPCSAQYVKNLNAKKFEKDYPRAASAIIDCHYVDDYVDSFDTADEAIDISRMVKRINASAGFELRGFLSNCADVRFALSDESSSSSFPDIMNFDSNEVTTEKVLGMYWRCMDDRFCFILKFSRVPKDVLSGARRPTKAEVLSLTMSIFDPFGYLANVTIKSKIILQTLWRLNIDWKSPIPEEIFSEWYNWYKDLDQARSLNISRCYHEHFNKDTTKIDLHIFVDASELAYAAVAYWRIVVYGNVSVVFVAGKSRCSPIKALSVPRLELLAAVLGVRLKDIILSGHDVKPQNVTFWSDSKTVLSWIMSDSRCYKQFVAHRIAEILDSSDITWWRWVPGKQNPADDATRMQAKVANDSLWLSGPKFLEDPEASWPILSDGCIKQSCDVERRLKSIFVVDINPKLINFEKFSNYYKLLRVLSWVRLAVLKFKSIKINERKKSYPISSLQLTAKYIYETEKLICRLVQNWTYPDELRDLSNGDTVSKNSPLFNLTPMVDEEGVLRLSGRIDNAECVPLNTKRPIILPNSHHLTGLIARYYHEKYKHQNQESIVSAIRRKFWIPNLRRIVKSAAKNCQYCKNKRAEPKPPLMGQLPRDRLTAFVRVFSYTGVDFFGPYFVAVGRRREKRWGCLFTCLTVRAIHLELARDLSADAFIICLRNFINRRGVPTRIRSDRGTNFVGASKEDSMLVERGLVEEGTRHGIEWIFNSPGNPSAGGAWERMVRCVKRVLSFTLKTKVPQIQTLQSLFIEAESLVNSRPLTYLPLDHQDAEPLTPNHFILGCPNDVQTPSIYVANEANFLEE
uniref:Pro-Pol polyprotein n=1 Tax=Ceratitis capitata TaxID=7213 RepID=W8AYL5_CERCA